MNRLSILIRIPGAPGAWGSCLAAMTLLLAPAAPAANQFERLPALPTSATISWCPAWGDYDNDGDIDLAVPNGSAGAPQTIDLYRNRGDGSFERMTAAQAGPLVSERGSWGEVVWTDMDNDGWLDLIAIASAWGGGTFHAPCLFRNQRDGSFHLVAAGDFTNVKQGIWPMPPCDLDGDGWVDLLAITDTGTSPFHYLFFNRGDGTLARRVEEPFISEVLNPNADFWADIDDDGDLDVFVSSFANGVRDRNRLYLSDGHGRFTAITNIPLVQTSGGTPHGAWGDYDGDGDFDVVLSKADQVGLFRNDAGTFVPVPASIPLPNTSAVNYWVDYDNDALLDLYLERGQWAAMTNTLLRNLGNGTFAVVSDLITANRADRNFSSWGDLDNDGDLDLVESTTAGGTRLFRNLGNANHWLKLRLKGTASNAAGLGALVRVRATVGGRSILQTQHVGGGMPFQQDLRPNFGLGDATRADEIVIRWPSGNVQILTDIAADRILDVTEPTGITPVRPVATVNGAVRLTGPASATSSQWYFDGRALEGQTNRLLTLTNAQPSQAGRYAVVSETDSGPRTNHVNLRVLEQFTKVLEGELVTERFGSQFASWFDYDGDGRLDLHVGNSGASAHDSLFRNAGEGVLVKVTDNPLATDTPGAVGAALGDWNNDGRPDVFIARPGTNCLYRNEGNGVFTSVSSPPLTTPRPGCMNGSWSDYNSDGLLDLFVAYGYQFDTQRFDDALFRGLGGGAFAAVSTNQVGSLVADRLPTWSGVWFDCDEDGDQDLLVVHGGALPRLHRNNGDGTFTRISGSSLETAGGDGAATVGDYDNDGRLDVFLTYGTLGRTALHRNLGGGIFSNVTATAGIPLPGGTWPLGSWADFDNDGHLDLLVTTWETNALYRNRGDGTFQPVHVGNLQTDGDRTVTGAWGDYDDNGFPDLLLSCGDAIPNSNHLYRNAGNSNHWLKVRLQGTASNRSGIGAKVRVRATLGGQSFWQLREVSGNASWNGAQQLIPAFGLGNATRATTVRIEWPSGTVQEITSVAADQVLDVIEPLPWKLVARPVAEGIRLEVRGPANQLAEVQWSGNLKTWFHEAEVATDATGSGTAIVALETLGDGRFYRIRNP